MISSLMLAYTIQALTCDIKQSAPYITLVQPPAIGGIRLHCTCANVHVHNYVMLLLYYGDVVS